jgi:DnaJ-class molecular chaperone
MVVKKCGRCKGTGTIDGLLTKENCPICHGKGWVKV